ncbi:tyrosine-protein phosphatase [Bacillus sp. Marseille-P3661]|uniref:tyrosine-protein phosphatase n=1 Tax=Bacillus sp. Marseille-P3661 TaxID=1936234 RepID=UPI000C83A861|nr:CpsB/CapC family capsule biosynthesis tyrosine phosphatase [Bacillus sp. Marseille-P3661]
MIDLHSHILPGIDDGPKTIEESLELAKHAVSNGIKTMFATPHHKNGSYENAKTKILQEVEYLNKRLLEEEIELTILPGQEVRIYGEIPEAYDEEEILTLNHTPYLFIELPSSHVPKYAGQILFDLQVKGLKPIIVHPERNSQIIEHSDTLYHLVKKGALTQLTASSITGDFGKKIQKFSFNLIQAGMAHFIASDTHNVTTRANKLRDAYEVIEKEFGTETRFYFQENAEIVANNQTIYAGPPERIKRKKFLGIF